MLPERRANPHSISHCSRTTAAAITPKIKIDGTNLDRLLVD